jgi:protein-disulfide isomerase
MTLGVIVLKKLGFKSTFLATMIASTAFAADASVFNPAQQESIEKIVHQYLVTHPEVLIEASKALQEKQQQMMEKQVKSSISDNATDLFNDKITVMGNPKGNITVVEFFDYQCIHCKKMSPVIAELIASNKDIRVIYKEFPIFGEGSLVASKAALAASLQGKYQQMHDALFKSKDKLDENKVMLIARSVGLNLYKLKKDMHSEVIDNAVEASHQLGEKLHLMGTPAFIVASTPSGVFDPKSTPQFVPGAISKDGLMQLIEKVKK